MKLSVSNRGALGLELPSCSSSVRKAWKQKTLKSSIGCIGIGLHTGARVAMNLHPAPPGSGIVFRRVDLIGGGVAIPAHWSRVVDSRMCTVIADSRGVSVATVEHLMAAFYGLNVDNAVVEINGPEVPAMDGSAHPFIFLMECAGLIEQDAQRKALRILRPTTYMNGNKKVTLGPSSGGLIVDFEIDFKATAIGRQACSIQVENEIFRREVCGARTFGLLSEVTALREAGLARGGSLENAIVVDGERILNDDGLRCANEFVFHKALDVVGDMYLSGYPIIGHFFGSRSSHADTWHLLRDVLSDRSRWDIVDVEQESLNAAQKNSVGRAATF